MPVRLLAQLRLLLEEPAGSEKLGGMQRNNAAGNAVPSLGGAVKV